MPSQDLMNELTELKIKLAEEIERRNQVETILEEAESRLQLCLKQRNHAMNMAHQYKERLRKFMNVVEQTTDYVMMTNKEGVIEYINPALKEMTGYTDEDVIGKTPAIFQSGFHDSDFYNQLWQNLWAGQPFKAEFTNRKKNGEIFYEEKIICPIKDEAGEVNHFVSTGRNVGESRHTERDLRRRNRELALLNQASQAFISSLDLDDVLISILNEVRNLLNVTACSAWLLDADKPELICRQATEPQSELVRGWRIPADKGIVGSALRQRRSIIVADILADDRHFKGVDEETGLPLRSILSVPLLVQSKVIGVIQAVDSQVGRFKESDLNLLEPLAAIAAIAVENARLYDEARENAKTKAMLLSEVNHRVKNNLAAIIGMLYAERRQQVGLEKQERYQGIMDDLINRIQGLATVHRLLSAAEWSPILLTDLAQQIIRSAMQAVPSDKRILVDIPRSSIRIAPKQANHFAIIINELTTNTVKYALIDRPVAHITIRITLKADEITFIFQDDGLGFPDDVITSNRRHLGLYLIETNVQRGLRGHLTLRNEVGAVVDIKFPLTETQQI